MHPPRTTGTTRVRCVVLLIGVALLCLVLVACGRDRNAEAAPRCDSTASGAVEALDIDKLAWKSDQIVVGTVIEVPDMQASPLAQPVAVLEVESRIRGKAADTLQVYACQFTHPSAIFLTVGERMLFFGTEIRKVNGDPLYQYVGAQQGLWRITDGERVESPVLWSSNVTLAEIMAAVSATLADGPDDRTERSGGVVSLDDAPLVPAP